MGSRNFCVGGVDWRVQAGDSGKAAMHEAEGRAKALLGVLRGTGEQVRGEAEETVSERRARSEVRARPSVRERSCIRVGFGSGMGSDSRISLNDVFLNTGVPSVLQSRAQR